MVLAPISIRSALFALRKAEVIDKSEFRKLHREWANHRKANGLDAYGNKPES
jgi:ribosomal protein L19E